MALRRAPALAIRFAGGLETKEDSKTVPAVKLLNLENATFIKQSTLAKRNGYEALGRLVAATGLQVPDAIGLATRSDELVAFDGGNAWSYRDSVDAWDDAGEVVSVVQSDRAVAGTATQQTNSDHATNGGITVVAWEDSRGGVYCEVTEQESGRVLVADTLLDANGQRPRCIPCGTVLHVIWARPTGGELRIAVVNPAVITTPVGVSLTTDLSATNPSFDACAMGGGFNADDPGLIAWANNSGGYRVGYLAPPGVIGTALYGLPSAASWADSIEGAISVSYDKTNAAGVAVVWVDEGVSTVDCNVRILDEANLTSSLGGPTTVASYGPGFTRVACEWDDVSILWWAAEGASSRDDQRIVTTGSVTAAAAVSTSGAARVLRGHSIASRAYIDNGDVWVGVCHPVEFFPYVAFAKVSTTLWGGATRTLLAAQCLPGTSTGVLARSHIPSVHAVDPDTDFLSRQHSTTLGYRLQLQVDSSQAASSQYTEDGIRLLTLDHDNASSYQSAQLGAGLYLASACIQHYDGRRWTEAQILAAPDQADGVATLATAGAGGSMDAGTYNYVITYEDVDALGEITRSAASVPVTVVVAASGTVSLELPTYRLTAKEHTQIAVFRSQANATGDPEAIPYFRVTGIDPSVVSGNNCYVPNDPTVDTITFVDALSDTLLQERSPLYTNGGILSNDPAPCAGNAIAGGKGRLFWTDPSDPLLVRYSQQIDDSSTMETSIALSLRCDPYGGAVVAIGVMDGAVYPFKATAVMVFGGPGPDADGGFTSPNAFSPVELVTSDVGCSSTASICQLPDGIAFQSSKGIKLLDRQRNVQDIGSAVYALNDQTITRATLLPDRHQVVFLVDAGYALLFDYQRGQWSKYTNHEGYDAVVRLGTYYYVRTDGRVFRETPGLYADEFNHITMKIETAWLSAAEYRQGWQRIWHALLLGAYKSEHTLKVRYRIDYRDAYAEALYADVNANFNPSRYGDGNYGDGYYGGRLGDGAVYQREFHLNQRCQAIAFEISDVEADADFGASFELSELLLTGGILGARFQVGAARRG